MKYLDLEKTPSTNSYVASHAEELENFTMVSTRSQTAGRGQRGNTWESIPGKNLTCSIIHYPENFAAIEQFFISEAVALAVVDSLKEFGVEAKVKWPNDIYVADKKICGILIENALTGSMLSRTIIGIGINLNQTSFFSDAPNPVSLIQITGKPVDIQKFKTALGEKIEERLLSLRHKENKESTHNSYKNCLWRGEGLFYPYRDKITNKDISARIVDIESTGHLIISTDKNETRRYAFKEIEYIL